MRKRLMKRTISALLAMIMVLMMIPFSVFFVNAVDETEPINSIDKMEKYRLDILNNITNDGLVCYVNDKFDKMKIESVVDKGKSTTQTILSETKKICNIAASGCKILSFVPGVKIAGDIIGGIGGIIGEFKEDNSTDILISQLQEMQQELGTQLTDINKQIVALSSEQRANMNTLASYLIDKNDKDTYKAALQEFANEDVGNNRFGEYKDYYNWKINLLGRYDALLTAITKNKSDIEIKEYYDDLYLVAQESSVLYKYLTKDEGFFNDTTLQEKMYRYYILGISTGEIPNEQYNSCIEQCISYSEDWYSTYKLAQMCLNICYSYQLQTLIKRDGADNLDASTKYYLYKDNKNILYNTEIYPFLVNPQEKMDTVTAEMAKYYARILNLDESYIYEINDDLLFNVKYEEILPENMNQMGSEYYHYESYSIISSLDSTAFIRTNNKVNTGNTMYMNVMPEVLSDIFDVSKFSFQTSDPSLATVNKAGIVNVVGAIGEFIITMCYGDQNTHVYSMKFKIAEKEYSGGMGCGSLPYIISSEKDLIGISNKEIGNKKDLHYLLISDIDCRTSSEEFNGISEFSGVFDGNNYSIYGFTINSTNQGAVKHIGFIGTNNGIVKDLTIGNEDITDINGYSVSITSKTSEVSGQGANYHSIGGLAGLNNSNGRIINCRVINTYVNGELYDQNNNEHAFCSVGGLVGKNLGIVGDMTTNNYGGCVSNSLIKAYLSAATDSGDNNYAYAGGITGINEGSIWHSISHNNIVYADARGDGKNDDNMAYPEAYSGGAIGDSKNGDVSDCIAYTNNVSLYASSGGNTTPTKYLGYFAGCSKNTFSNLIGTMFESANCDGTVNNVYCMTNNPSDILIPKYTIKTILHSLVVPDGYVDSGECMRINDVDEFQTIGWNINEDGYPTFDSIKLIISTGDPEVGGPIYRDITEYIRGETYYKYSVTKTWWDPEAQTVEIINYPLDEYRIDTSLVGDGVVINLIPIVGTTMYEKVELPITVVEEQAEELFIFAKPIKTQYEVNTHLLDTDGMVLVVVYNNGTVKPLSNEFNGDVKEYTENYDFSNVGKANVTFGYENLKTELKVDVVRDGNAHVFNEWYTVTPATCAAEGMERRDCTAVEHTDYEKRSISKLTTHTWGDGVITTPATVDSEGVMTYTCTVCGAIKNEVILKLDVNTPKLIIQSKSVRRGDTVTLTVMLSNAPDLKTLAITGLAYDESILAYSGCVCNVSNTSLKNIKDNGDAALTMDANTSLNGVVFTYTFTVKENAVFEDAVINCNVTAKEKATGAAETTVNVSVVNGVITVTDTLKGDVNNDNYVDSDDAIYMLWYTIDATSYPITQSGDFNGDSYVDSDDAIYLLWHTIDAESYPLH